MEYDGRFHTSVIFIFTVYYSATTPPSSTNDSKTAEIRNPSVLAINKNSSTGHSASRELTKPLSSAFQLESFRTLINNAVALTIAASVASAEVTISTPVSTVSSVSTTLVSTTPPVLTLVSTVSPVSTAVSPVSTLVSPTTDRPGECFRI